MDLKNIKPVR